ncbi:universal stress protein [Kitasatospora sp. NPDC059146]|uniref:universal stress protein n=1 Tax=unclassified Kitasatospora TaxID=2633591 RepID=UPI003679B80B
MARPVLAAVDGSFRSRSAALWAADEAVRRGTPLRLIHVGPALDKAPEAKDEQTTPHAAVQRMLAELTVFAHGRHPDLDIKSALIPGEAVADELATAAAEGDLLVLGTRGLGGFRGLLVGSVGLGTVARTEIPTILIRAEETDEVVWPDSTPVREIVVGLDTHTPADAVLEFAFREAALTGARLRVLHGWDLPSSYGYAGWLPPETELLKEFGALETELLGNAVADWRERFPEIDVTEDIQTGGAAHTLITASAHASLLVIGRRARRTRLGLHIGPVAHAVIHHSKVPTAVIPHP